MELFCIPYYTTVSSFGCLCLERRSTKSSKLNEFSLELVDKVPWVPKSAIWYWQTETPTTIAMEDHLEAPVRILKIVVARIQTKVNFWRYPLEFSIENVHSLTILYVCFKNE